MLPLLCKLVIKGIGDWGLGIGDWGKGEMGKGEVGSKNKEIYY
jgi:hypothetical protein